MAGGVKVVGAGSKGATSASTGPDALVEDPQEVAEAPDAPGSPEPAGPAPLGASRRDRPAPWRRRRVGTAALAVVAVLGVAGTVIFGVAWAGLRAQGSGEAQARAAARSFLVDLTNFDAKTVDPDFSAVTAMATGPFATQATQFFNSSIRQELQKALASSRGQIRDLYVQSYGSGRAEVYAVVDQLYVNDKITSPQTDVLRIVVDLAQVSGDWKVSDVSVLQGPTLGAGTGSTSSTTTTTPATGTTTTTGGG